MAHLTRAKREQLATLHRLGKTQIEICSFIGCSQGTVSKELGRNNAHHPRFWYDGEKAQMCADQRRRASKDKCFRWHDDPVVLRYVVEKLRLCWSPEQIGGRMKRESPWHRSHVVSHEAIYDYIDRIREDGGCFHRYLRHQGRKRKWHGTEEKRGIIPNRRGIEERPKDVDRRKRFGDWESDLVVGESAVATFVERVSKLFRAVLLSNRTAPEMTRAARVVFSDVPLQLRHTLTHDNGREISDHETITNELHIDVFCAHPYHSWERGLNEHTNGLLRQFFPKGTDFRTINENDLALIVALINNRPRRSLQYRTPEEVFQAEVKRYSFQN
ncbi:IS30 family transposase [Candidatus Peregrinibacteria bacterium]|nr:IS30 family transposase [Candidatus Peregrinibacteria bacterium]MBI3816581.1 IS30 family transposase [Candidatus Peregrinibacteria bacterium]